MNREEHQPECANPQRENRSREEMQALCGRTVAFIMALTEQADIPAINAAVNAARYAQMAAAIVLASPACAPAALEATRRGAPRRQTLIQAVEYDPAAAIPLTRDAGDFELFNLPYGLLETTRVITDSLLDDYEAVVIMDAAQDKITADHLYELCLDAHERPEVEVVASWIQQLRRTPVLLTHAFLDRLGRKDPQLCGGAALKGVPNATGESGTRPVPRMRTFDHVFGDEQLAASIAVPSAVESFLGKCTLSALEAVQLAKRSAEHPAQAPRFSNEAPSPAKSAKPGSPSLNNADALLVKTASETLAANEADLPAATSATMPHTARPPRIPAVSTPKPRARTADDERAASPHAMANERTELEWADAFGRRNKLDFPLLNDRKHAGKLAYLDSAATSQRVSMALQAQYDYDAHENANVYRGAYELSVQSTLAFSDARKRLEDFIGAERNSTVFTTNTTGATSLVALAWGERNIHEGDLIVCGLADHHSNSLSFLMLAQRKGARIEYVPYDECGRTNQEAYAELLGQKPKLVCLTHIGNVFGIEAPVKAMAAAAHAVGARVLVDAAQSFPHLKIDVDDLGADWVAMSAHKAYGPMGIGALWIASAAFDEMDPLVGGGGTVTHVGEQSYHLRPKAPRYEPGTPPVSQAVGWAAAIEYLDSLGVENVARHGAALTRYAARGLQRIDGVNVLGDHTQADGQNGLVSFTVRSVEPGETARFLGRLGVAVRSGGHCALPLHAALGMIGTGRLSIAVHTTRDDIDAALTAIALCRQAYES